MNQLQNDLGDRMKSYEAQAETRLDSQTPIIARLDGRGFSRLCRDMEKPDERFNRAMMETCRYVVEETHASLGYTQSDEISIVFLPKGEESGFLFDGRIQKIASVLASMATVAFNRELLNREDLYHYAERMPIFDGRVYQVPSVGEAANALLWRVRDASKNAVSMVAQSYYSHKQLQGVSTRDRRQMLTDIGVDFDADYPSHFRNGSFWKRTNVERLLTSAEWTAIPEKHRPPRDMLVIRSQVMRVVMPDFIQYQDIEDVLTSVVPQSQGASLAAA